MGLGQPADWAQDARVGTWTGLASPSCSMEWTFALSALRGKKEGRATHRMRLAKSGGTNHSIERAGGFLLAQARLDLSRSLALH